MKLKFTIHYHTAWGESLHVNIDFHSQDGVVRRQNLLMQTKDGELWTLETAALMSRHHPLSHIVYSSEVADAEGQVLRREWDVVPRVYAFDATKDYLFPDEWRDRPLPLHLYSNAYLTTVHGQRDEQVGVLQLPLFRRTIIFRVSAPQLKPGQVVAVCGSHPAIGSWSTSRYLKMHYAGRHEWMLSVNAQGWLLPIEYKYVVVDGQSHELLKAAGVVVPVFSLRSEHSYGVGDFGDLRRMVDWAVETGMKFIQTLPVCDTTTDGHWHNSYPYNITSVFALHPHYIDLEAAGTLKSKTLMTQFERRRLELNALPYSDYEAVERVKNEYLEALYEEQGTRVLATRECKDFIQTNEDWLKPYAHFRQQDYDYVCYVQYLLHTQLKAAADYARSKGVVLKGDLPIGVNRDSVETRQHPELFNLDSQTGAPPDQFSPQGQNWGFPTYHWDEEHKQAKVKGQLSISQWFQRRMQHMQQYNRVFRTAFPQGTVHQALHQRPAGRTALRHPCPVCARELPGAQGLWALRPANRLRHPAQGGSPLCRAS